MPLFSLLLNDLSSRGDNKGIQLKRGNMAGIWLQVEWKSIVNISSTIPSDDWREIAIVAKPPDS